MMLDSWLFDMYSFFSVATESSIDVHLYVRSSLHAWLKNKCTQDHGSIAWHAARSYTKMRAVRIEFHNRPPLPTAAMIQSASTH
jgi:hypothetical protein